MARRLTLAEAQQRIDDKFPNSGVKVIEFQGANRPCVVENEQGDTAEYSQFATLFRFDTSDELRNSVRSRSQSGGSATRLTLEDAQKRLEEKYPDSGVQLVEFYGTNNPCAFKLPSGKKVYYKRYYDALQAPTTEAFLERLHAQADRVHEAHLTGLVPNPITKLLGMVDSDWCKVLFYPDIQFVGGDGIYGSSDEYYQQEYMEFDRALLRKRHINPQHVVCFKLDGDSLSPMISSGATVALDTNNTDNVIDGKVYAFIHEGMRRVKILRKLTTDHFVIMSVNPKYDDEVVSRQSIQLIGRVFWYSQEI